MSSKKGSVDTISIKPTQKQKKYMLEREQADARADLKIFKRDFFENLPSEVCRVLDSLIWRWRSYDWFEEAWNKYRDHVLDAVENNGKVKMPGFVFNDYINDQVKKDFDMREELMLCHSELEVDDYLQHHGIKGQRWGVRRFQNEDGTLTDAGKRRYLKGYTDVEKAYINAKAAGEEEKAANLKRTLDTMEGNQGTYFDRDKWDKDSKDADDAKVQILKEVRSGVNTAADAIHPNARGSKIINNKDYSKIPDDEMRRRINRLSMEKQYGDLTGDNKYVMTGKEKAKEVLQTIGAILGIAGSAVTVALLIKEFGSGSGVKAPKKK